MRSLSPPTEVCSSGTYCFPVNVLTEANVLWLQALGSIHSVIGIFESHIQIFILYQALHILYEDTMSGTGRGFGLGPRPGRGKSRQQPSSNRWISVHTTAPTIRTIETLDGPIPGQREEVERQFTTYCALHLGHNRKTAAKKVELLRHLFNLVRMVDETAAILPFLPSDTVNSVCHATHISEKVKDFEHYLPDMKYYHDKIRTNCRFATSISINAIKNKIFGELRLWPMSTIPCFLRKPTSLKYVGCRDIWRSLVTWRPVTT